MSQSMLTGSVLSTPGTAVMSPAAYTDIRGMQNMDTDSPEALRRVAAQFESLFMDMWLKSMREAGAVFSEGNPFSSPSVKVHEEMLDHQYAVHLSEAGGVGIGDALVAQLTRAGNVADAAPGALPDRVQVSRAQQTAAAITVKSLGAKREMFSGVEEFVDTLLPVVEQALAGTALNPVAVLAQAALETGWGRKVIHDGEGANSHNLFGIKANGWQGPSASVMTMEFEFDRMTPRQADFRAYGDWDEAVTDYVKFLQGDKRYQGVMRNGSNPAEFARELQQSGYATDPGYADKLLGVVKRVAAVVGRL